MDFLLSRRYRYEHCYKEYSDLHYYLLFFTSFQPKAPLRLGLHLQLSLLISPWPGQFQHTMLHRCVLPISIGARGSLCNCIRRRFLTNPDPSQSPPPTPESQFSTYFTSWKPCCAKTLEGDLKKCLEYSISIYIVLIFSYRASKCMLLVTNWSFL